MRKVFLCYCEAYFFILLKIYNLSGKDLKSTLLKDFCHRNGNHSIFC